MNTSNSTAEWNASATPSSDAFGRTSMIGMFIALQLCQLTQPYGSLIFRGHGGSLWRCNPLSSFTEACLIFFYLTKAAWTARTSGTNTLHVLQRTAGALLLLRAATDDDEEDIRSVLVRLMQGSTSDGDGEALEESYHVVEPGADVGDAPSTSVSAESAPTTLSWQPSLESGRTHDTSHDSEPSSRASRTAVALRAAFGDNMMARKDLRVDMLTAFAELCVVVKVLAVKGDPWFQVAAVLLIIGWLAVQSLLILFHHREMKEEELRDTARVAVSLDAALQGAAWIWDALLLTVHLPLFGYWAHFPSFHDWIREDSKGSLYLLGGVLQYFKMLFSGAVGALSFWGTLYAIFIACAGLWRRQSRSESLLRSVLPFLTAWLFISSVSYYQQTCIVEFTGVFDSGTLAHRLIDDSFRMLFNTYWLVLFLMPMMVLYLMLTIPGGREWELVRSIRSEWDLLDRLEALLKRYWNGHRAAALNALLVLTLFAVYVARYDGSKSHKPSWTELLG